MNNRVSLPEKNEELAELFGILTGDGFINYYPKRQAYVLDIAGNKIKDKSFLEEYVCSLFLKLFKFKPKIYFAKNQNTMHLVVRNKEIFNFIKGFDFPVGKKEQISIPSWILDEKPFMVGFVRGVFDTDGYLCLKNKEGKKYPVIGITSISLSLLNNLKQFTEKFGITSYLGKEIENSNRYSKILTKYRLQISGRTNINLFFDKIGSNNPRNLNKYQEFLKL